MKKLLEKLLKMLGLSDLWYLLIYRSALRKMGEKTGERERRFKDMIQRSANKACMQVGVRDTKYAPHWISVDLYDTSPLIDYNYDLHALKFEDHVFDFVACLAVLEHVEYPQKAITELHRVLKPGGEIWVEIPFNQPYHPSPGDYWRVTPDGMRIWMSEFDEISSGVFSIEGSVIYNGIYFHGKKKS